MRLGSAGVESDMQVEVVRVYFDGGGHSEGVGTFVDVPVLPDTTAADVLRCCILPGDKEENCALTLSSSDGQEGAYAGKDTIIEPGSKLLSILHQQLQHQALRGGSGKARAVGAGEPELGSSRLKLRLTHCRKPAGLASTASTFDGKAQRTDFSDAPSSMSTTTTVVMPKQSLSKGWSFDEIQRLAVHQRQSMAANQKMLADREQQLRDLEATDLERARQTAADTERLRQLQAYAAKQEAVLQQVRAARATDADSTARQQLINSQLNAELDAAHGEFQRKQIVLAAAVAKVADLTKQLEQLKIAIKANGASDGGRDTSPSAFHKNNRIRALLDEYEVVKELRAQRGRVRAQLQDKLCSRLSDAADLDGRLAQLQLDARQRHQAILDLQLQRSSASKAVAPSSFKPNAASAAIPSATRSSNNIAAVEPFIHTPSPVSLNVRSSIQSDASVLLQEAAGFMVANFAKNYGNDKVAGAANIVVSRSGPAAGSSSAVVALSTVSNPAGVSTSAVRMTDLCPKQPVQLPLPAPAMTDSCGQLPMQLPAPSLSSSSGVSGIPSSQASPAATVGNSPQQWSPSASVANSSRPCTASADLHALPASDEKLPSSSVCVAAATSIADATRHGATALHGMLLRPWLAAAATSPAVSVPSGMASRRALPVASRLPGPTASAAAAATAAPHMISLSSSARPGLGEDQRPTSSATMVVRATPVSGIMQHGDASMLRTTSETARLPQGAAGSLAPSCSRKVPTEELQQPMTACNPVTDVGHHAVKLHSVSPAHNGAATMVLRAEHNANAGSGADMTAAAVATPWKVVSADRRTATESRTSTAIIGGVAAALSSSLRQTTVVSTPTQPADVLPNACRSAAKQSPTDGDGSGLANVAAAAVPAGIAPLPVPSLFGTSKDFLDAETSAVAMEDSAAISSCTDGAAAGAIAAAGVVGKTGRLAEDVATAMHRAAESRRASSFTVSSATSVTVAQPVQQLPANIAATPWQAAASDETVAALPAAWPEARQFSRDNTPKDVRLASVSTAAAGSEAIPSLRSSGALTGIGSDATSVVTAFNAMASRTGSESAGVACSSDIRATVGVVASREAGPSIEASNSSVGTVPYSGDGRSSSQIATSAGHSRETEADLAGSNTTASPLPSVVGGATAVPSLSALNNRRRRVSFDPQTLLLDAALQGELDIVQAATKKVSPSVANEDGVTALHNAIIMGNMAVVEFLVKNGGDVNAQDIDGWMPLHCAASCNNLAVAMYLVANGACVFATTSNDQQTASQKCEKADEGYEGCLEYLQRVEAELGEANGGVVYALYDYEPEEDDELELRSGQRLTVLRRGDSYETEWWWARHDDEDGGDEGYVARNLLGMYRRPQPHKPSGGDA